MQIILKERVEKLGEPGDVVRVKPGYARNFLLPRGLAYEATPANIQRIERERAQLAQQAAATLAAAREQAGQLEGVSLTFPVRAGQEGRLFGSITSADIAEKLAEQGHTIDRRQIELEEPIKAVGVYGVPVRLHTEVRPEIKVWVVSEE